MLRIRLRWFIEPLMHPFSMHQGGVMPFCMAATRNAATSSRSNNSTTSPSQRAWTIARAVVDRGALVS